MEAFPLKKELLENLKKYGGKTDWYSCSEEDGSVSYIHYIAPEDRLKYFPNKKSYWTARSRKNANSFTRQTKWPRTFIGGKY